MAKITAETKVPLTSGKKATFKLEDGEVSMSLPASFKTPTFAYEDFLKAALELEAAKAIAEGQGG